MAEIDTILDNQEVNAQTLNDIAIDLGHTSFNGFGENKFGADELNGITSALVSSGILSSDNKCKPYISGGKVYISTGTIVFANGAKKKITETVELDMITNSYIYALNDTAHNICKILVSETAPADDDFVTLCEISADGTLIDKRVVAKAKVELPAEGSSYGFTEIINRGNVVSFDNKTITIPIMGAKKIFIRSGIISFFEYNVVQKLFCGISQNRYSGKAVLYQDTAKVLIKDDGSSTTRINIYLEVQEQNEEFVTFKYSLSRYSNNETRMDELPVFYYVFGGVER